MPHAIRLHRDLVDAAPAQHAVRAILRDRRLRAEAGEVVGLLEQQPAVRAVLAPFAPDEIPATAQLLAVQFELEPALRVGLARISRRRPRSPVPYHHRAAAVLALRDHALEVAVFER